MRVMLPLLLILMLLNSVVTSPQHCPVSPPSGGIRETPVIAVYYYAWYGGYSGVKHWNDSSGNTVVDVPEVGFKPCLYNSLNEAVIKCQLELMKRVGVDALFISLWNPKNESDIDEAARKVFSLLRGYGLKACIMLEPWYGNERPELYNESWWSQALDYVWENYVVPFRDVYFEWEGRPLILAYNPIGVVYKPDDPRFTIRVVGNDLEAPGKEYVDWDLWPDYDESRAGRLRVRVDGYVALTPRFDEHYLYLQGARSSDDRRDVNYTEGWYIKQWEWVVGHLSRVRLIAIYSWNEYHERSMIEPHIDRTAGVDPYYLLRVTWAFVRRVKGFQALASWVADRWALRRFLEHQYVEEVGMLREGYYTEEAKHTVWIASDNLLASRALQALGSPLGAEIASLLDEKYGGGCNNHHELLVGRLPCWPDGVPLLKEEVNDTVKVVGNYTVRWERHDVDRPERNWSRYADLVLFKALYELAKGRLGEAKTLWEAALSMFDGYGLRDASFDDSGVYETYKLALLVYTWRALMAADPGYASRYTGLVVNASLVLAQLQDPVSGGFWTHYKASGRAVWVPRGVDVNTETSSIVALALYSSYPEVLSRIYKPDQATSPGRTPTTSGGGQGEVHELSLTHKVAVVAGIMIVGLLLAFAVSGGGRKEGRR